MNPHIFQNILLFLSWTINNFSSSGLGFPPMSGKCALPEFPPNPHIWSYNLPAGLKPPGWLAKFSVQFSYHSACVTADKAWNMGGPKQRNPVSEQFFLRNCYQAKLLDWCFRASIPHFAHLVLWLSCEALMYNWLSLGHYHGNLGIAMLLL